MLTVSSHVATRVKDTASILDFYCDKLGFAGMLLCRSEGPEGHRIALMAENSMQAQAVAPIMGH